MSFIPYVHFSGTCTEAMAFYCTAFHGTDLVFMKYSELPPEAGGLPSDLIMHAQFTTPSGMMMASDMPPGMPETKQQAVSIMIDPPTLAEGLRLFDTLSDGGAVIVPFAATSWSPGFGMMEDKFGTHWIIGTQPAT